MQRGVAGDLLLQASDWSVRVNGRDWIRHMDFELPANTCLAVVGESGSGKSSLLRLLAGAVPKDREESGEVLYLGSPLETVHVPPLVTFSAKVLLAKTLDALLDRARTTQEKSRTEWLQWLGDYLERWGFAELLDVLDSTVVSLPQLQQRVVAIAREALAFPPVLLIDDLTKDLTEYDSFLLLDFVRSITSDMSVMVALSDEREAGYLRGQMIVLEQGQVIERGFTESYLQDEESSLDDEDEEVEALNFGESDDVVDSPSSSDSMGLAERNEGLDAPDLDAAGVQVVSANTGPRGFFWLIPGKLAGTPLPGVVSDLAHDLGALQRCGIQQLISLSPHEVDATALSQAGIKALHLAGVAKEMPTAAQLRMMVRAMSRPIVKGQGVAVHCVSGNGRTGLLLATYLVIEHGMGADEALAKVQACNPSFRMVAAHRDVLLELATA